MDGLFDPFIGMAYSHLSHHWRGGDRSATIAFVQSHIKKTIAKNEWKIKIQKPEKSGF